MIEPTEDEGDFLLMLEEREGSITFQGEIRLLKLGRLVPEYVEHVSGGSQMAQFSLTKRGWALARMVKALR